MAGLRKVTAGEPLVVPASAWNAFVDAAQAKKAHEYDVRSALKASNRQTGIVLVKNASGYDCPRFGVLGIAGPLVDPADDEAEFAQRVVLSGAQPAVPTHTGAFVVPLVPILQGEFGNACIDGVCVAKVTIADEDHGYADVDDGESILTSVPSGTAQILWKQPPEDREDDVALAIVRLGPAVRETCLAKLTGWAIVGSNYNRWKYAWSEVTIDPATLAVSAVADGRSGTTSDGFAVNLAECANTAATGPQGHGVNTAGDDYPAGFFVQPLGGGRTSASEASGSCANQVVCVLERWRFASGTLWLVTRCMANSDDGTCE